MEVETMKKVICLNDVRKQKHTKPGPPLPPANVMALRAA